MDNFSGLNARVSYERQDESISDVFHENSKMRRIDGQYWGKRFSEIRSNVHLCKAMSKTYKEYPNCESIELCKSWKSTKMSFEDIIINRRTTRACLKIKNCTKHLFLSPFYSIIKKKGCSLC